MSYQFTIIVPVFNEKDCLPELFIQLKEYLPKASLSTKILLVDDGSSDGSSELIQQFCLENEHFGCLIFEQNFGKGAALKAAFDHCDTEYLGYLDADLQTYPEDFERLLPLLGEYDLVTGWRKERKDSVVKKISSKVGNGIRIMFTNDQMHDTGCPLKVMKTSYAKKIPMFKGLQRFFTCHDPSAEWHYHRG